MTEVILFSSVGLQLEIAVSPCSLLNGELSSSYLPYALKHGQSQAFSDLPRSSGSRFEELEAARKNIPWQMGPPCHIREKLPGLFLVGTIANLKPAEGWG